MLIWVSALHCEAKPVIDCYRLKKSQEDNAFDLYLGDGMACVISGVGKIACAAACGWVAARFTQLPSLAWINLGIAGSADHELGSLFSLHQVIDADDGRRYYPAPASADRIPGSACMTLSRPSEDYLDDCLFDMEASGFMYACLRFSSAELIKSLKVVSDNQHSQTGKNRAEVSRLVQQKMDQIKHQATVLIALNNEIGALSPSGESWQRLTTLAHFSQTQKNRLRVLWRYLMNRGFDSEKLLTGLSERPAATIIRDLEKLSHQDSEKL